MKYVYVLENEEKFRNEIAEALYKIDPRLVVRYFNGLEEFGNWIQLVMQEGAKALPKGGVPANKEEFVIEEGTSHELNLIISKNEIFGTGHMSLIQRTRDLFIKKGLCTVTEPTALVLTSFESPQFDIKQAEKEFVHNVIFKPFDKLMLSQHLVFAIDGRRPPSQYFVHSVKAATMVEMLKVVEIEAVSEVGFVGVSQRPLNPGVVSKYYSPAFASSNQKGFMASCLRSNPHPERPGFFRCAFTFLGADSLHIANLRKEIREKDVCDFRYDWVDKGLANRVEVVLITDDPELNPVLKMQLEKTCSNIKIHVFPHLQSFLLAIDPGRAHSNRDDHQYKSSLKVPDAVHAIFADQNLFGIGFQDQWNNVLEAVKKKYRGPMPNPSGKVDIFAFLPKKLSDVEESLLAKLVRDVFYYPLDTLYLTKKLMIFFPQLRMNENLKLPTIALPHKAKVANPVEMIEFSEAGIVFKYDHPIGIGTFRDFLLWPHSEQASPEFMATCNFTEESSTEKGVYFNHFVFFGVRDQFLKHLRRWILQNHVENKDESFE